ncbi:uncharacterized protein FOMMEDRAFT_91493 [Fomitiporia mediterranea MF3/22]|uniref:uncharacterized protein n=1 Tax=Fomitiporia mediterranea (strain MF3/22) TaxID=694068 RepID=UPI00044084C0|nr:uncharacterized protein FOMMEDRAFT_91493 [Fomitiporia mediterranea MF3/22]EJD00583.1 hypothetical protein FOMMEDRAFT_91493 [Fomitiporia mediterranea MF3/22]
MPPDLNGKVPAYKALPRERDLETRRAKGEASCAECRRLKLKCDRKVPCTSCIRRGCQTICPNGGSLASGQGSRFVLANTDRLHEKLLRMSARIRQLEDALQIAQASVTPVSHPLLSEELLAVKSCVDIMAEREDSEDVADRAPTSSTSGLGTLSISDYGETCFMGRGSSEVSALDGLLSEKLQEPNNVPQQILSVSRVFPFAPADLPKGEILRTIEACLPSYARATALVEAYLSNIAWSLVIVDREQIFEELLPSVYKRPRTSNALGNGDNEYDKDYINRLALLLAVFGNGAAGDLTLPIGNEEAELFTHLARAALSINSVFTGASMEHVQTIILLAAYGFFACVKSSLEPSWKMLSFGLSLASSVSDRDPARWNLEPRIVQRRRRLFWELFTSDKWTSVESGRPATFNLHEIDVEFPQDKYATIDEDGNIVPSYWHWKFRFMKEVMAPIAELLCLARPIKYAEVIELDRRCREFQMPSSLLMPKSPEPDEELTTSLRRFHWALIQEVSLLSLHRGFFARALLENPVRPLGSPFASSLLSAYASAVTLLKILRVYFDRYPDLLMRQWMVWAHALSSTIIVGSVACRGPASFVAAPALKELEAAIDIFKNAQMHPVSKRALVSRRLSRFYYLHSNPACSHS